MDLKSVIKTFAEAWAAASIKMEKSSSSSHRLPLPPPWDTFPKVPPSLPLVPGWPTQGMVPGVTLQNMARLPCTDDIMARKEVKEMKNMECWERDNVDTRKMQVGKIS